MRRACSGCRHPSCALHHPSRSNRGAGCRGEIPCQPGGLRGKRASDGNCGAASGLCQFSRSLFMLIGRGSSVIASAIQVLRGSRPSATTRFVRSRSETIPTSLPLCSSGTAPMLCSRMTGTVSSRVWPISALPRNPLSRYRMLLLVLWCFVAGKDNVGRVPQRRW